MKMMIQEAKIEDAKEIAKVHVRSWQTTYKGIMSDNFLQNLSVEQRTDLWISNMQRVEDIVIVAIVDDKIIGFASGAKVKEGEYPSYDGDITSIYFYEEYQGKGYGKELLGYLIEKFKQKGFKNAIVKVLEENKSRYFYEKLGAKLIDQCTIQIAGGQANLLTYAWDEI
ncbi:GNAT family N-acetyltransferase [Rummeliibacillus pycnus]|uniref:GNAT family N-acetyltransferase n=1 Tax=Rummeliibacillus pycnus TaxID=101070 RepID=UPI0037C84ECF